MTFAKDGTPRVYGFGSLTLNNQHHFFAPNDIKLYSEGTKNKALKPNAGGSLTTYVEADTPAEPLRGNWQPSPKDPTSGRRSPSPMARGRRQRW